MWEDITDDNLRDLFEKIKENYAPTSAKTVCATIKAVIRENDATKVINSPTFGKILRTKAVSVQSVYLSDEEINRIINYNPRGQTKRYVQRMFLMECLCGARYSDCQRICRECGIDANTKVFKAGMEETGKKYRFISSHTGRRSFATNLSKKGVPLEQIAVMMGHLSNGKPNIQMTMRYIVGKTEIDSNTLRLFGVYDKDDEPDEELSQTGGGK